MGLFDYRTYLIDEKLLSVRDTLIIKDEKGEELGKAIKKFFTVKEEIEFIDNSGKKLGFVNRKLLTPIANYEVINQNKKRIGTIKKKVIAIGDDWRVEDPLGKKILDVDGNITGLEYKIEDTSGQDVAEVSKSFFSIRDHYGVRILEDVDPFLILAVVIAINMEKKRKEED